MHSVACFFVALVFVAAAVVGYLSVGYSSVVGYSSANHGWYHYAR